MWNSIPVAVAPLVGLLGICLDLPHVTAKVLSPLPVVVVRNTPVLSCTHAHSSDRLSDWMK